MRRDMRREKSKGNGSEPGPLAGLRVAVYARFSTDMQRPTSIEDQLRNCQTFASRQGWGQVPPECIYSDRAVSGATAARTAYQRLLADIAGSNGRPPYDVVLTDDLSRLTRDMEETARLVKLAPIWDIRLIGVTDGLDTGREDFEFDAHTKGAFSAYYRKRLAKNIHRGLTGRFLAGYHPGGPLYGFRTEAVPDPSGAKDPFGNPRSIGHEIRIYEEQAAVVRRIFRDAAGGLSPREIAGALSKAGVPKPWAGYAARTAEGEARRSGPWSPTTVARILENERYAGRWAWNRTKGLEDPERRRKIHRHRPEEDVVRQERPHLALVDRPTWDRVQAHLQERAKGVLRDPQTGKLRGREPGCAPARDLGNPWKGLVTCHDCGGPVGIVSGFTRRGHVYRYVGCVRHWRLKDACPNAAAARLRDMDEALRDALRDYFADAKLAQQRSKRFYAALNAARQQMGAAEGQAQGEVEKAEQTIERVRRAILEGITGVTTAGMLREAEGAKLAAEARLEALRRERLAKRVLLPPEEILAALRKEAVTEQRRAYEQLVEKVVLKGHRHPGRKGSWWEGTIYPHPLAGIEGIPKVAFGADREAERALKQVFSMGGHAGARGPSSGPDSDVPPDPGRPGGPALWPLSPSRQA